MSNMSESNIREFFKNANVFITGATGFLGNVLLDKLIRCCPEINMIYVLIRNKKGVDSVERFKAVFNDVVFDRLKKECPNYMDKVTAVSGDCSQSNLGLSDVDRETLVEKINIVFHVAATVRFDAPIQQAVGINIKATKDLLLIAKQMKQLKAFVHISTAYSNCAGRDKVDEIFYDNPINADALISVVDQFNDGVLERITPGLIDPWPNTYAFTKAVAEQVVKQYGVGIPVTVVRPSIVIATIKDPIPGWINNFYGPTGVVAGAGVGLLRSIHVDGERICDLVPCDTLVNAIIAAAWNIGVSWKAQDPNNNKSDTETLKPDEKSGIPILNYVSSNSNPLKWKNFMIYNEIMEPVVPSMAAIWIYRLTLNKHKTVHKMYCLLLHLIPAMIVDTISRIMGKEPKLWSAYEKIHKFSDVISYFSTKEWIFTDENTKKLYKKMGKKDKEVFNFDLSNLDWKEYCYEQVKGIRVYLIKDSLETIPEARERRKKLLIAHYTLVICFWCILLYFAYQFINLVFY